MTFHLSHRFPHYFKNRLPVELEELYLTAALMDFAGAAIALFEPIYLWSLNYTIPQIMLFYVIVYAAYFFLVPLGGKFIARYGSARSIAISTVFLVAYYLSLVTIASIPNLFYIAPIFFALQKTFYWPAYHFDFLRFAVKEERGSEFSGLWTVSTVMYVLGPIIGGLVVRFLGFTPLFIGAALMILFSSVPLFLKPVVPKVEQFSYWKSMALPFRRRYQRMTLGYMGLGEELLGMTIWPIFIFLVYGSSLELGFLVGISAFITSIVTLAAGKLSERVAKTKIMLWTALVQAGIWIVRLFSRGTPATFTIDTAGRSIHNTTFVTMTSMTYERAHDDDFAYHGVMFEQGFAISKALTAIAVMLLAMIFAPFKIAFVVGAILSLFYILF